MLELAPLITDLAVMLGIASIAVLVFQRIHQPVILGYIIAGVIIGPYTPPHSLVTNITQIETLSELGVIFLMFALGLDFSFHKLKKVGISAIIAGSITTTVVAAVGFYIGRFMHWQFYSCLFLGAALSISSTTIIIKSLDELNLKGKRFADLVFGILIVEDLLAVLMLTILSTITVDKHPLSLDMILAYLKFFLVIGGWFLSGYFVIPLLFRNIIKYISQETLTIISIALCLLLVVIAAYFHYSTALGAFIMGSILAETPLVHRIKQLTLPLRDVFAAVFFISVGMMINFDAIIKHWPLILAASALTMAGQIVATTTGTFLSGQSLNTSIRTGFSMSPIGEFSFIIVSLGILSKTTNEMVSQVIVGVAAITTFAGPYLMQLSGKITTKLDSKLSDRTKYLLESYTAWAYRASASHLEQNGYLKFIMQLTINGVAVMLIFNMLHDFALPQVARLISDMNSAKIYTWMLTMLVVSPFVWGMSFSFKAITKNRRIPALLIGTLVTIAEVTILNFAYFGSWYLVLVIVVLSIIVFILTYKQLGVSYYWLEWQVVNMLGEKRSKQNKREKLAPWDTHLVNITANNLEPGSIVNKTLSKAQLRQKFGVNIVAIRRGSKIIPSPRGLEHILPGDELVVLGDDTQIDKFKEEVEDKYFDAKLENILENFSLKAIVLEKNGPYVGKSIHDSMIREETSGILVGLERSGRRILNPESDMMLKPGDLLMIVSYTNPIAPEENIPEAV